MTCSPTTQGYLLFDPPYPEVYFSVRSSRQMVQLSNSELVLHWLLQGPVQSYSLNTPWARSLGTDAILIIYCLNVIFNLSFSIWLHFNININKVMTCE